MSCRLSGPKPGVVLEHYTTSTHQVTAVQLSTAIRYVRQSTQAGLVNSPTGRLLPRSSKTTAPAKAGHLEASSPLHSLHTLRSSIYDAQGQVMRPTAVDSCSETMKSRSKGLSNSSKAGDRAQQLLDTGVPPSNDQWTAPSSIALGCVSVFLSPQYGD